jgi:hypothetical protein
MRDVIRRGIETEVVGKVIGRTGSWKQKKSQERHTNSRHVENGQGSDGLK